MLEGQSETRVYQDGDRVFEEGDQGDDVFLIKSGKVRISKSAVGHAVTLAVLQEGDLFAEMALLEDGRRTARATAIGDVTLAVYDKQLITDTIQRSPEFALGLLRTLSHRLVEIDELVAHYVTEDLLAAEKAAALGRYIYGGPLKLDRTG